LTFVDVVVVVGRRRRRRRRRNAFQRYGVLDLPRLISLLFFLGLFVDLSGFVLVLSDLRQRVAKHFETERFLVA